MWGAKFTVKMKMKPTKFNIFLSSIEEMSHSVKGVVRVSIAPSEHFAPWFHYYAF